VTNLNDSGDGSLRAQIGNAQDGDTVNFARGLSGTIALTSGVIHVPVGMDIVGPGAGVISVSGEGNSGVFEFDSPFGDPPIVIDVSGLTITGGDPLDTAALDFGATLTFDQCTFSGNQGSALDNVQGILTLQNSLVSNNTISTAGLTLTAGLFNGGTANITGSVFSNNISQGATAVGGAILTSFGSVLNVSDSQFQGNQTQGGFGGAFGGAIHVDSLGEATISHSTFTDNVATGAGNNSGGAIDANGGATLTISDSSFSGNQVGGSVSGSGGAINNFGSATITGTSFSSNQAIGSAGSGFDSGGAISNQGSASLTMSGDVFTSNVAQTGTAPFAGFAAGGAIVNLFGATAIITDTQFRGNQAIGADASGAGNAGAFALGGAIESGFSSNLTLTGCDFRDNQALGGRGTNGAAGGIAQGGAIDSEFDTSLTVTDTSIKRNLAQGGSGGGNGLGGGVYIDGTTATFTDTMIVSNTANGGSGGGQGIGGGLYINSGAVSLKGKTKVVGNHASTSNNDIFGNYTT
jgi:hypothetical protein